MIAGLVNARYEAVVSLRVRGPSGVESLVNTIIDSGSTAALTLPMKMVTAMGLARKSSGTALLADGTTCQFAIFSAEVEWGSAWRQVLVSAVGNEALLGMRLMAGHKLVVEVVPGGSVEIKPHP